MSTSPSPLFKLPLAITQDWPPRSPQVFFTSPSNHRTLPLPSSSSPPLSSSSSNSSFSSSVYSFASSIAHTFVAIISVFDPFQALPSHVPLPHILNHLPSFLPHTRLLAFTHSHPDSSSPSENGTDSPPLTAGGSAAMIATASVIGSSMGVHQPDQGHGRPDQNNFAANAGGDGAELGQNTYAKQC